MLRNLLAGVSTEPEKLNLKRKRDDFTEGVIINNYIFFIFYRWTID